MNYELNPHRYRELKHFCLQYKDILEKLRTIEELEGYKDSYDPTSELAVRVADYKYALKLIETTAHDTEEYLADKILQIVTEDVDIHRCTMPCTRECLEELRHRFYWLLDKNKGI